MTPANDAPPEDLIGTILGERYRIEQRLTQGGMGVIYRARHTVLDTALAVKVLLRPQGPEDQQRFLQEAKLASVISHPNTVQIIDFGVLPSGQSYLVMEFMRGRTLGSQIATGPMEVLRVCRIGAQIARGLQAVHDRGIVHRDMKPDNVFLVNQNGNPDFVKILDFGIAKAASTPQAPLTKVQADAAAERSAPNGGLGLVKTMSGLMLGTPPYMSPEQCRGGVPVDARSDQYSVGCILYEMLAGERPFVTKSLVQMLSMHILEPVPPLSQRAPQRKIPTALQTVVMRMLQKEPAQRFGSMNEVAQILDNVADILLVERGEKTVLPSGLISLLGTRVQGSHIFVRSRPVPLWAAFTALIGVLLMVLGGVGYLGYRLYQYRQDRQPKTLRPGELQGIKTRALAVLRQVVQPAPTGAPPLEPALRIDAIDALGHTQDAALRPDLEGLLDDADETVQAEAAAALGRLGDPAALARLRVKLEKKCSARVRLTAARALLELGDSYGEQLLGQTLAEGAPEERLRAASLLCDRRNSAAEQLLLQVVDQGLLQSESAVLGALGCLLRSRSAEQARTRLRSRLQSAATPQQQIEIARVLALSADPEGRKVLRELATQPGLARLPAARALAAPDVPEVSDLFRGVLNNRQAQEAAQLLASQGLGLSGQLLDVRLLDRLLKNGAVASLKESAAAAVLQLSAADPTTLGSESLRWARGSLGASDWRLRESAALVLGSSVTPEAVLMLREMLNDSDPRVRRGSVCSLGRRTEESALLALQQALHDADLQVRLEALRSLGRLTHYLVDSGARDMLNRMSGWFTDTLRDGTPSEQILARTMLLQLGDTSQIEALRRMQHAADAAVRRFLIEHGPPDLQLAQALRLDPDASVRFAAARKLAESGDTSALDVLREALAQNGPESIIAYGLLAKLKQPVTEPEAVQAGLKLDQSVPARMAAIDAMAGMPSALAVPLLLQGARDPEPLVRRLCAEIAADLPPPSAPDGRSGVEVLRFLVHDCDPTVRQRAAALLSRVESFSEPPTAPKSAAAAKSSERAAAEQPVESPAAARSPEAPKSAAPPELPELQGTKEAEETPEPGTDAAAGKGILMLDAPESMVFQLDGGKWQNVSSKGISVGAGPHLITTLGGEYEFTAEADKKVRVKLNPSPVDEAVQSGSRAYQNKDYGKAQKNYDRANALCSHDRVHKKACASLELMLALERGKIFEEQRRLSEAMAEYQKAVDGTRGKTRVQAAESLARLAPQLGKVVLRSLVRGKCQERVQWLLPGKKQKIKVGDQSQPVNVRAGQTVEIGSCS